MAAGPFLMAVMLGVALGASGASALPHPLAGTVPDLPDPKGPLVPQVPKAPVGGTGGPLAVSTQDGLGVAVDAPLPVGLDTGLSAAGLDLTLGASPRAAETSPAESSASASRAGPLAAIADAPPEAVAAGGSLLAGILGFLLWLARPALGSAFGLFSRIEDDDLARHPLRRQALDVIAANPGASVRDVQRSLGIAWGTAVYHLGRLERAGLVAVRRAGCRAGHWPLGQAPPRGAPAPTGQALVDLVRQRPGLTQAELAQLAGIGAPAACKQLRRLESAGLLSATRLGRARVYRPGPALADAPLAPIASVAPVAAQALATATVTVTAGAPPAPLAAAA